MKSNDDIHLSDYLKNTDICVYMNILVTGANGQLGNEMRIVSRNSRNRFLFTDIFVQEESQTQILDITDIAAVRKMVKENKIDVIVNCAAYTDVEKAESNPAMAEMLNAEAPRNLASAMQETDGLLIHISTDYVFGKEPYNIPCLEDQKGTPTGVYGVTKLHGEENIISSGCKHVIIRTAWLYSEFGRNFCKTMLSLTSSKPEIKVVFDQVGTPTYALDLARAIAVVCEDYSTEKDSTSYSKGGIYHFSNEGVCSWYDFAKAVQAFDNSVRNDKGSLPTKCSIQPCHSNEFPSAVVRPAYSVLDKTKIKTIFPAVDIPYWMDSLRECISNIDR